MGLLSDVCQYSSMFMLVSVLVSRVPSSAPITENKTFHARDLLAVLFWPPPRFIFRPNQFVLQSHLSSLKFLSVPKPWLELYIEKPTVG